MIDKENSSISNERFDRQKIRLFDCFAGMRRAVKEDDRRKRDVAAFVVGIYFSSSISRARGARGSYMYAK